MQNCQWWVAIMDSYKKLYAATDQEGKPLLADYSYCYGRLQSLRLMPGYQFISVVPVCRSGKEHKFGRDYRRIQKQRIMVMQLIELCGSPQPLPEQYSLSF